ncbi:MAG: hypothetical protein RR980_05145 [Mucinivorans sp.]
MTRKRHSAAFKAQVAIEALCRGLDFQNPTKKCQRMNSDTHCLCRNVFIGQ